MSLHQTVATAESPLYSGFDEFRRRIYKATGPDHLNTELTWLNKGRSDKTVHNLSDQECARVMGLLRWKAGQLGLNQRGFDNTFYRPLPK